MTKAELMRNAKSLPDKDLLDFMAVLVKEAQRRIKEEGSLQLFNRR